ncbi:DUF433 domain-containing protein [Roseiflexus sp.]|uniref:DUF433 domain-containing protein n=1 Tax=Roseiflexus sp. TaxID=2562120 RepID=UPI00398AD54F
MSMTITPYEHIVLDDRGSAKVAGTTMKVIELIIAQTAYGWSPEELHFQYPYLSLGQIHSALAYYWDHKEVLDRAIAQQLMHIDVLQTQATRTSLHTKLKAHGLR